MLSEHSRLLCVDRYMERSLSERPKTPEGTLIVPPATAPEDPPNELLKSILARHL